MVNYSGFTWRLTSGSDQGFTAQVTGLSLAEIEGIKLA